MVLFAVFSLWLFKSCKFRLFIGSLLLWTYANVKEKDCLVNYDGNHVRLWVQFIPVLNGFVRISVLLFCGEIFFQKKKKKKKKNFWLFLGIFFRHFYEIK
jgi:hypothetical protein